MANLKVFYDRADIISLYKNGMSKTEIQKKIGCSRSTVERILKGVSRGQL